MEIKTISDFRAAIRNGAYTWPGGYPLFFITSDGGALSFKSAKANRRNILWSLSNKCSDGWRVVAVEINWEDTELVCDHSGKKIESAYGDDSEAE